AGGGTHHGEGTCGSLTGSNRDGTGVLLHAAVGSETFQQQGMVSAGLQLGALDGCGHSDRLALPSIEPNRISIRIGLITGGGSGNLEGAGGGRELNTAPIPSAPGKSEKEQAGSRDHTEPRQTCWFARRHARTPGRTGSQKERRYT